MTMQLSGSGTIIGLVAGGLPAGSVLPEDITPSYFYNALTADVAMNAISAWFTGPQVAQGAVGTWLVMAHFTVREPAGPAGICARITDGTTIVDSCYLTTGAAQFRASASLCGIIVNPTGNLRLQLMNVSAAGGLIEWNVTGAGKDSSITAVRIG